VGGGIVVIQRSSKTEHSAKAKDPKVERKNGTGGIGL
jgi:hypothetical protein